MKTGRNLQEVLVELNRQNQAKQDFISPAQGMHLREDGHTFEINHLTTNQQEVFGTTSLFHRQVASALGIPAKYYDLMQKEKPELLAENVNSWFADKPSSYTRILRLEGPIDEESFWGDEITPQMFRDELESGEGDVTVWINSPGGNVFAAAEIYTMLKDYKGSITVKIDAIAASAASVVAMAGDTVQMSPVAMLMIHDPSTVAMGNTKDMEKAIEVLTEVKESIINAYAAKSGLSHARIANLMSNETWMNAKKAVELGFADEILFAKKEEEPDSDPVDPENPEEDPDSEPGEGEEKKPFQKDTAGHLFSSRQMDLIVLNRLGVKPEDVGQKYTEPKKPDAEPPADPKPSAEPTPPAEPPANLGPVLDMDGKTEDGSIPYNILMKQLECMK